MRICAFIATSLDGFIARQNGEIDWLEHANAMVPKGEDCGFSAFYERMDCLVLGRKSFEKVLGFSFWPYGEKKTFVMTQKGIAIPPHLTERVIVTNKSPENLCKHISELGFQNIYIDGGQIIRAFLNAKLLNEITITRIPVLIHEGIPLFEKPPSDLRDQACDTWLKLSESRSWSFGFVQELWKVDHSRK